MTRIDDQDGSDGSEPVGDNVRILRRGEVWYANFQNRGKQHRLSLRTTSKKEARRRALQIEGELAAGRWQSDVPTATVNEAVVAYQEFLRAEERSPKTLAKYNKVFDRIAELADRRGVANLGGLDLKFVDAYRAMRVDDGAQAKTRYTETVIVRQLINFSVSRGMVTMDPMKGLKLKKPKPTEQPCWTRKQVEIILAGSPDMLRPALTLLAESGMRFGEMAWLSWDDIDFQANVLRIRPKDGWKPKTGDGREVPMSPRIMHMLASLPRHARWVVTMPPTPQHPKSGRQWTERRLLVGLKHVLKTLGLPGKLHTFRHSFISNALLQGTAVAVVRQWAGHVDAKIIDSYTHVHDDASQLAMQRLAKANNPLQKEVNRG